MNAGAATTPEAAGARFTAQQAARLTGATRPQLDAWRHAGLIASGPGYGFRDLVAVRLIVQLLESGLSLDRIRPAVRHLTESDNELRGIRLVTDGDRVRVCHHDTEVLDALGAQPVAVVVTVDPLATATETAIRAFDAERQGFVAALRAG